MGYLIPADFKKLIQSDNLNQIINNDPTILAGAIDDASAIATERLVQKYIISQELQSTDPYSPTAIYKANQRVYLTASAYDPTVLYLINNLTLQLGNIYVSIAGNAAEAFNPAHWTLLGPLNQIYYVPLPAGYLNFLLNKFYNIGDKVFYLDNKYTALKSTITMDHNTQLQYQNYASLPLQNIFPNDPNYGTQFWGTPSAYQLAANQLPGSWTKGDNRNASLVRHCMAIALYIIHDRVSPRMIPELREKRYTAALKWLSDAAEGNITAALPLIQPRSGGRIRWGGNIKNVNNY